MLRPVETRALSIDLIVSGSVSGISGRLVCRRDSWGPVRLPSSRTRRIGGGRNLCSPSRAPCPWKRDACESMVVSPPLSLPACYSSKDFSDHESDCGCKTVSSRGRANTPRLPLRPCAAVTPRQSSPWRAQAIDRRNCAAVRRSRLPPCPRRRARTCPPG